MAAGYYNLIADYTPVKEDGTPADVTLSVNPYWVIAVVRLASPVTFCRAKMRSNSTDSSVAAATRGDTLIVTSDCYQLRVSGDKSTHLHSLDAQMVVSDVNYVAEILPGDWVMSWMLNDEEEAADLVKRIKRGKPCNKWGDGFKFLGRVTSMRKVTAQDPSSGIRTSRYSLQASGFRELDSSVFYDPHLAENHTSINSWMGKLGKAFSDLIERPAGDQDDPGALSINKVIPYFLDLLVGDGFSKRFGNPGGEPQLQILTGGGGGDAPFAYVVPKEVGDLLGKTSRDVSKAGGVLAYADLLELIYGVQRYQTSALGNSGLNSYSVFIPDGVDKSSGPHKYTGRPMLGLFTPDIPQFSGKTVWSILNQWLNPTINEMYTSLRVNANGDVVPTITLRQMPFSSDVMVNKKSNQLGSDEFGPQDEGSLARLPELTPFMELPRWRIHDVLAKEADYGRSDALRFNFIHVYGQSAMSQTNDSMTRQIVRNPPIRDDLDIQRSGLRPYMTTVACSYKETREGPRAWMEIAADWLMGQHLTFTGTINLVGVQAPLFHGDNVEFDGVVFHVESYVHACQKDLNSGRRSFITSLNLTHGMRSDTNQTHTHYDPEFYMYPGMLPSDSTTLDPGISVDQDRNGFSAAERRERSENYERSLKDASDAQAKSSFRTSDQPAWLKGNF